MSNTYWALAENIESKIMDKIDDYQTYLRTSKILELWRRAFDTAYRAATHGGDVLGLGENGEFAGVYVNEYRSLADSKLNMILAQNPVVKCMATNTDYSSQVQAKLGDGVLEYYKREKGLMTPVRKAVAAALKIFGEAFVTVDWDVTAGEEFGTTETGAIIKNGDLVFKFHTPNLVTRDPVAKSNEELDWYIVTRFVNKFELAAKYPDKAEQLVSLSYDYKNEFYDINLYLLGTPAVAKTDLIALHTLYHQPTGALPNGRLVECVEGITLIDTPFPYREIPVCRVTTGDLENSIFGYTEFWDLLPLQKITDTLHSTATTNQSIWGVSSVAIPRGANVDKTNLGGGLNIFEFDGGQEPKQFNMLNTSPEVYGYMDKISSISEKMVAIPATRRGAPESSLKSGAALALVASQALENAHLFQTSFIEFFTKLNKIIINMLQDFATVPRMVAIVGKANRTYMKEFVGQDLDSISRVMVDVGNPLMATVAGRVEIAQNYMNVLPEFRDKWINIVNTGRIEPLVDGDSAELLLIQSENESLQESQQVQAIIFDNHAEHIKGHATLLSSPEARQDPNLVNNVLAHIQEHFDILNSGDPLLEFSVNQTLPPAPPMPPPPLPPMQGEEVPLPSMPTNPMTGEEFTPNVPIQ